MKEGVVRSKGLFAKDLDATNLVGIFTGEESINSEFELQVNSDSDFICIILLIIQP